ncbi:MAG: hypothetical protein A4E28_00823 [Methanocella sp. PtaU1.Bin125]|nr:MAG: hypothetical protein A4E28_00823 [Methanocella sp. PtaU1.Bin125]
MRQNDRVVLLREIKVSIDGGSIPEGAEGVIVTKISGSGWNTFEVDFGEYGTAICDKNDLSIIRDE